MGVETKQKSEGGFTLIELMIATVIFVFGLVAVLTSVMTMFGQQRYAEYDAISSNYINFFMDDLQDWQNPGAGTLANVTAYQTPSLFGPQRALFANGGGTVTLPELGTVTAAMVLGGAGPGVSTVEVNLTLTLTDYRGRNITKTESRIIAF